MIFTILIAFFATSALALPAQPEVDMSKYFIENYRDGRIVGGEATYIWKHPYICSLQSATWGDPWHFCGCVIIHERFALTAGETRFGFLILGFNFYFLKINFNPSRLIFNPRD